MHAKIRSQDLFLYFSNERKTKIREEFRKAETPYIICILHLKPAKILKLELSIHRVLQYKTMEERIVHPED